MLKWLSYTNLPFFRRLLIATEGAPLDVAVVVSRSLQASFEGVKRAVFSRFPNGGRHDI
jgi:hypothetical protein